MMLNAMQNFMCATCKQHLASSETNAVNCALCETLSSMGLLGMGTNISLSLDTDNNSHSASLVTHIANSDSTMFGVSTFSNVDANPTNTNTATPIFAIDGLLMPWNNSGSNYNTSTPAISPCLSNAVAAFLLNSHPPSPFANYAVSPAMSPVATPLISNQNLHPSTTPLMMSVTTSADAEMALYLQQQQFLQQQHQQNQMNAISETAFAQSLADMDVQIFRKPFEHFTSEQFTAQALPSVTTAAVILPLPETLEPSLPPNLDDDMNFVDAADVSSLSRSFSEHAIRRPSLSFYLTVPSTKKSTRVSPPSPYHGFYSQSKPISRSSTPLPPARSSPVPCFTTSPIAAAESCSLQSEPASNTAPRSSSSASSLQSFAISQSSSSLTASTLSSSKLSRPAKKSFKIDGSSVAASAPHSHPFQCPVEPCTRTYKSKSSLDHHVTTFHGGQRRFSCTEKGCGKRYQTKNRLTVHMRSHTGEMPYECKFDGCSFAAAQKCALTHHQKRKMHFHVSANNRGSVAADGTDDGEEEMDDFVGKEENMET